MLKMIDLQINVPRSASFNVQHVPLTNLTNRVLPPNNMAMIHEDANSTESNSTESTPVTKLSSFP